MPDAPSYPPPGPTDSPGPDPHAPFRPPTSSGASYAPSFPTQQPGPHAPYGAPGWQQAPHPAPQQKPGGAVGVVALVLACVPLVVTNVVGIVLGIMGIARGREGRAGYGTSLAAVVVGTTVLSIVSVAGLLVVVSAESEPGTTTSSSGDDGYGPADDVWEDDLPEWERPVELAAETVAFGDLQSGDCYWDDGFWEAMYPDAPEEVDVVPCDEVHGLQVLGGYELDLDEWPGRTDMYDETDMGCGDLFFELTTDEYVDAYETWWVGYGPDRDAFDAGERSVTCVFVHDDLIDESAVLPSHRGA